MKKLLLLCLLIPIMACGHKPTQEHKPIARFATEKVMVYEDNILVEQTNQVAIYEIWDEVVVLKTDGIPIEYWIEKFEEIPPTTINGYKILVFYCTVEDGDEIIITFTDVNNELIISTMYDNIIIHRL